MMRVVFSLLFCVSVWMENGGVQAAEQLPAPQAHAQVHAHIQLPQPAPLGQPPLPQAAFSYQAAMEAIKAGAKALDVSQKPKEELEKDVSELLTLMNGTSKFGFHDFLGTQDEEEAWDYLGAILSVHNKATPELVQRHYQEALQFFKERSHPSNTAHAQMFYGLLKALSLFEKETGITLDKYFTNAEHEEAMHKVLDAAMLQVNLPESEKKNAQAYMQTILWRLFVKRYLQDESIESLKKKTELYLDNNNIMILPGNIGNLISLTGLYLSNNQLTTLPESIGNLTALQTLDLSINQITTLPGSIARLRHNLILLDLSMRNSLAEHGEGDTLGLRELREIFGDHLVTTQNLPPITLVSREDVLTTLDAQPLHINRNTLKGLNPPKIPETELNANEFMQAFEGMINALNFNDHTKPGYIEVSLLYSFSEEEIQAHGNEFLVKNHILPRLRGFLKALVGLPLAPGEPEGWQMYEAQKPGLKNALAYIFEKITKAGDPTTASLLFTLLTNGILHCPTGQKEGVDSVVLALTAQEGGKSAVASAFDQRHLTRMAQLKNEMWRAAVLPGDNVQNVHILSYYANKTAGDLDIYTALGQYDERIFARGVPNDPFKNSVGNVLQVYFKKLTPAFLIKDLKNRISTWEDEALQEELSTLQKTSIKPMALPQQIANFQGIIAGSTARIQAIDALLGNPQALLDAMEEEQKETGQQRTEEQYKSALMAEKEERQQRLQVAQASLIRLQAPASAAAPAPVAAPAAAPDSPRTALPQDARKKILDLRAKIKQIKAFVRPYALLDVINYLVSEKLLTGKPEEGQVQGWENYFDKDPQHYLVGAADKETFPTLTDAGAARILLHLKILDGAIPPGLDQKPLQPVATPNEGETKQELGE